MYLPIQKTTATTNDESAIDSSNLTTNSTQTPSDLSPNLIIGEDVLPQAHHQNPGHCIASFSAINRMRQNIQVIFYIVITSNQ